MPISKPGRKSSTLRSIVGMALLTVGVLATVGTVLGFFGSFFWAFDMMAGYRFQMAVLLVVAAVIYGLLYARATGAVFAIAAGVNVFLVLPLFIASPAQASGVDEISVASYDTARSSTDTAAVLDWVATESADVIFLFETEKEWANRLQETEGPYDVLWTNTEERVYGVTVLSRIDLATETLSAGPAAEAVVRAVTPIGNGEELVIYATRAERATGEYEVEMRDATLEDVGTWVAAEDGPVVVVGPLNTSQWSYAFRQLKDDADLEDSMIGYGFQASYRADMWLGFRVPADQALYSPQLTTTSRSLGPTLGSDHLPLRVSFALVTG